MSSGGDDEMTTCREVVADHAYEEPSTILAALLSSPACRAELLDALTEPGKPYFTAPLIIKGEVIGHTSFYNAPADQPLLVPALVAREAPDAR